MRYYLASAHAQSGALNRVNVTKMACAGGVVSSRTDNGRFEGFSCELCSVFMGRSFPSVLTHIGRFVCETKCVQVRWLSCDKLPFIIQVQYIHTIKISVLCVEYVDALRHTTTSTLFVSTLGECILKQ